MIEAHSLQSITDRLSRELPRQITTRMRVPVSDSLSMTPLDSNQPLCYQTVQYQGTSNSKLVGILLCHPKTPLAKAEILDQLAHFHERSGESVDFFCVGYGAYWPEEHFTDQKIVANIDGVNWLFSEKAFSRVIDELECTTKWKYSGETELLLVTARRRSTGQTQLDFQTAIVCNLEAMAQAKAFTSVRSFFTSIFRYAKTHIESDPTWGLSDSQGIGIGKSVLKDAVLSLLPKSLREAYQRGEHYAVRSIG